MVINLLRLNYGPAPERSGAKIAYEKSATSWSQKPSMKTVSEIEIPSGCTATTRNGQSKEQNWGGFDEDYNERDFRDVYTSKSRPSLPCLRTSASCPASSTSKTDNALKRSSGRAGTAIYFQTGFSSVRRSKISQRWLLSTSHPA